MKIRIVSDIHCDINEYKKFNFEDEFIICCGDISGDRFTTEKWVNENIKQGIFVAGNHLGYNHITNDKNDSINLSVKYLQDKFSDGPVRFLENQYMIKDDIVFIGCILFTDFDLFSSRALSQEIVRRNLNDYRYVKIYKHNILTKLIPDYTLNCHIKSKRYINKICKEFSDKKIITKKFFKKKIIKLTNNEQIFLSLKNSYKTDLFIVYFEIILESLIKKN